MKKLFLVASFLFASTSAFATSCHCYKKNGDTQHVYNTCTDSLAGENQSSIPSGFTLISTHSGTPSNPGYCPAQNAGCSGQNCGSLSDSAYFDFHIQAGGVNQSLYVCEVGFENHYCKDQNTYCNNNDDYMDIYSGTTKVYTLVSPSKKTFSEADNVTSAKTYLNSLNFGAGWYVKYCLSLTRLTVGSEGGGYSFTDLIANIAGTVSVTPGKYMGTGAKDYFDIANLAFSVDYGCGSSAQAEDALDHPDAVWDEVTTHKETMLTSNQVCLNGQAGCVTKTCAWKLNFRETQTCVRPLKDKDKCPGPDCVPYEGTIYTEIDTLTTFSCLAGSC